MKLAGLVSFIVMLFSGCGSILNEANYYKHKDVKGKFVFTVENDGEELFLCKETKRGNCLLFDKRGEYLDDTTPDKCHKIKNDLYCPIPLEEDIIIVDKKIIIKPKKEEKEKETKIETKVKELQAKEDTENPKRTAKEILSDWWNK